MTSLDATTGPRSRTRRALVLATAVPAVLLVTACDSDTDISTGGAPRLEEAGEVMAVEHDFVIPRGTGERLDEGADVEILPRVLTAEVGDTIRIVNEDDRGHVVGVFFVGAGETLTQTFTAPGEFSGSCTVHTDGEFTLEVIE